MRVVNLCHKCTLSILYISTPCTLSFSLGDLVSTQINLHPRYFKHQKESKRTKAQKSWGLKDQVKMDLHRFILLLHSFLLLRSTFVIIGFIIMVDLDNAHRFYRCNKLITRPLYCFFIGDLVNFDHSPKILYAIYSWYKGVYNSNNLLSFFSYLISLVFSCV